MNIAAYTKNRASINSFDLLFFSGSGLISNLIKLSTGSQWSHVGLSMYVPSFQQVLCYESTTLSNLPDLTTGQLLKGVQLVPLSSRLKTYDGDVAWLPIKGPRTRHMKLKAAQFMRDYEGRPYEQNQLELIRAAIDIKISPVNQPDSSSVFCSEMVALMLRELGILQTDEKPANEFTPADFSVPLPLLDGYSVGDITPLNY